MLAEEEGYLKLLHRLYDFVELDETLSYGPLLDIATLYSVRDTVPSVVLMAASEVAQHLRRDAAKRGTFLRAFSLHGDPSAALDMIQSRVRFFFTPEFVRSILVHYFNELDNRLRYTDRTAAYEETLHRIALHVRQMKDETQRAAFQDILKDHDTAVTALRDRWAAPPED